MREQSTGSDSRGSTKFRKVANLYFLVISILSSTPVSPATNPVSPISNVLPLSIVVFVSLVKEAWEDWNRLQNDEAKQLFCRPATRSEVGKCSLEGTAGWRHCQGQHFTPSTPARVAPK